METEPASHAAVATLPPSAVETPPSWRRRFFSKKFLVLSVAVHLLLGLGATAWVVQTQASAKRRTFRSVSAAPNPSARAMQYQVQAKRQNAMSAPVAAKRATTLGPAKFALPEMPIMPSRPSALSPAAQMTGMGGAGSGMGLAAPGVGAGFGGAGGAIFMASIGGMNVQARQLAVALDVSGSVKDYQAEMQAYVEKTFKGSEVSTFTTAGFKHNKNPKGTISTVITEFLNSPKHFDSIYVFSDFGETKGEQNALLEVQVLVGEKKARLYLHILRDPGQEAKISPVLQTVIAFARSTGGNVKIGPMPRM